MKTAQFKSTLEAKQAELLARVDAIKRDSSQLHSADSAEQVTERENDEVLINLEYKTKADLAEVNDALERIKKGKFGYCEQCGQAISDERLQILLSAKYCSNCAI